jgi:hypothetical protein
MYQVDLGGLNEQRCHLVRHCGARIIWERIGQIRPYLAGDLHPLATTERLPVGVGLDGQIDAERPIALVMHPACYE